jgi:hypothetical protein
VFFFSFYFWRNLTTKLANLVEFKLQKTKFSNIFPIPLSKNGEIPKKKHGFNSRTCIFHLPSNNLPYYPTYLFIAGFTERW